MKRLTGNQKIFTPFILQPVIAAGLLSTLLILLLAACTAVDEPPEMQKLDASEGSQEIEPTIDEEEIGDIATVVPREIRLTPVQTSKQEPEQVPEVVATPITGEAPEEILEMVAADLVERSGADRDEIELVRAEAIIWPTGALGCPQPDAIYTQAQVPGYWIVFEIEGQMYDYRVTDGGYFFLCEQQVPPIRPPNIVGTPET